MKLSAVSAAVVILVGLLASPITKAESRVVIGDYAYICPSQCIVIVDANGVVSGVADENGGTVLVVG